MDDQSDDTARGMAKMAQLTDVIIVQIRKLADLNQQAILTDQEFAAKKTELLARFSGLFVSHPHPSPPSASFPLPPGEGGRREAPEG